MRISTREILIGKYGHAAYKPCYWTEQSLRTGGRRQCYKHNFGIKSHQCIQSTSFRGCNIACAFCWRDVEGRQHSFQKLDEPKDIAQQLVAEQTTIIEKHLPFALDNYENMIKVVHSLARCGPLTVAGISEVSGISRMRVKDALNDLKNAEVVWPEDEKFSVRKEFRNSAAASVDKSRELIEKLVAARQDIINVHLEAVSPKHIAISYDGEPTMYRHIGELIREFRKRGLSTFIVTNGTFPEKIRELNESGCLPTQLYVTLAAPDEELYMKVCSSVKPYFPVNEDHWDRLNETLSMLSDLKKCRTVIRITSVRGVNMTKPHLYRDIVQKSNPSFLEVKGFSISGNAPRISERLGETDLGPKDPSLMKNALAFAPTHEEIVQFARDISDDYATFPKISESELNRQILMRVGWKSDRVAIDFENEL